jgi:hypothetical protein
MVALAVGGLVLVFPKSDLMTLLRSNLDAKGRDRGNRDLSIAYLRNIIRTEPDDMGLRLLLAEKLLAGGDLLGARLVLDEAQPLARTSAQAQADWDVWDLNWWQAKLRQAQSRDRDSETVVAASELVKRLQQRVASVTTPAQVFAAIQSAQALQAALGTRAGAAAALAQARAIPGQLLQRLLAMPGAGMADLSRGASLALAEGQFQAAADLYFAARRKTAQRDARDTLLRQGVRALLAGGQPVAAWQAAVRETQPLPPGDELHWWLAELALAAAQPREAAAHLRNVVPVKDGAAALAKALPIERLQLAWDTFGAAADLNAALVVADAALLLQPQDMVWLERKAQASEWAGLAPQALAAWLALLKRNASDKALANVFRLSPMLYDDDALLAALAGAVVAAVPEPGRSGQGGGGVRAPGLGGRRAGLCAPAARRAARGRRGPARALAGPGSRAAGARRPPRRGAGRAGAHARHRPAARRRHAPGANLPAPGQHAAGAARAAGSPPARRRRI